ncbi:MAG: substrate-binding domain-containing protein [Candidatus Omnitrophica bacterium]|nr:substrate-binding domain-containing protein [Candidatus Omnitrophota bacterium]
MRGYLCGLMLVLALCLGCSKEEGAPTESGEAKSEKLRIAVIPKGTTHEFWKSIHAGAIKASRELDVEVIWKGPLKEDDREQQINVVQGFIATGVDGIVLAPLDAAALVRPVRDATKAGIPVVLIDSGLEAEAGTDYVSFVATDNYEGGALGARRLGELLDGKGNVILLRYQEGSASTDKRETGFLDTLKKEFPDINILSDNQYAGATTETGMQAAQRLLGQFSDIQGFYAPNESSTFGALRALEEDGRAGKVKFVGFDSSEKLVEAMRAGEINGLTLQNPFKMGYLGVKTMVAHLKGEPVEPRIDTGVVMVTPDNMDDPEVKSVLLPDLSEYLEGE